MLRIVEHTKSGYRQRTRENANSAGLTAAFAVDFNTAGERLTRECAGERYVPIDPRNDPVQSARMLFSALRYFNARVLNVAGNGIYTLSLHGWDQERADAYVYTVIAKAHEHWALERIVSGGQTGMDIAGGVAASVLGIPAVLTLPKGFKQRHEDKVDRIHTEDDIRMQVETGAARILARLREGKPAYAPA